MGKRLFENAEIHPRLVDEFFRENENPRLSWVQDIAQRRHAQAANALLEASQTEVTVAGQQVRVCSRV